MNRPIFPLITEEKMKLPFYVKSVGGQNNQEHISRPSGYTEYHWLHCAKGKGMLHIDGKEYTISQNMGFFFHPGIPHEYYAVSEPWETHWLTFDGHAVADLLNVLELEKWMVFELSDILALERLLNDIYLSAQSENPVKGFESSALLYQFLLETKNCMDTGDSRLRNERHKQLQPIISHMERNFYLSPTLEEMSDIIGVTPYHLCRLFKQTFNMRPFVYLTRFRLQKAKEFILESESITIREIALKVGYNDTSYFCAVFKEYEGITPTEFKKMHKMG